MASTMLQIRTSLIIGAAVGNVIVAAWMSVRAPAPESESPITDNWIAVSARLPSDRIPTGADEQYLVVTATAPSAWLDRAAERASLSVAIVIDRSGSMHGAPIEDAKTAALSMLRQLDNRDAFSIVTYSSGSEVVLPMQLATDANKAAARAAIETIDDSGGTCLSCGLESGAYQVAHSPVQRGLHRILLISDGQANEGVYNRSELVQLASKKASNGVSLSTVGVGLDFDETTLRRLAEVGRGSYYFVEDTVSLSALFSRELGNLSQIVATDVVLSVHPSPGVRIEEAYGYPMTPGTNGEVLVPVPDMRAGESYKVVLRLTVPTAHAQALVVSHVAVRARGTDRAALGGHAVAQAEVVGDPAAVAASIDRPTLRAVEQARSARALEEAAAAYDTLGLTGAQQVLERRSEALRANAPNLDRETVEALDAVAGEALEGFAKTPAKAKKAASVKAHELAR
jgi:Ca-activated chloride channel family protein